MSTTNISSKILLVLHACNTEVYINLEQAIFSDGDNSEYTTRIARTVKGARALLEAGFDFVTDMDEYKLFRKRK